MANAGFTSPDIAFYNNELLKNEQQLLHRLKKDPTVKNKLRTVLKKKYTNLPNGMTNYELKKQFCDGWLCRQQWYGKEYVQLLTALNLPLYVTEELLFQYIGNLEIALQFHAEIKQLRTTVAGKRKVEEVKTFLQNENYSAIIAMFPDIKLSFTNQSQTAFEVHWQPTQQILKKEHKKQQKQQKQQQQKQQQQQQQQQQQKPQKPQKSQTNTPTDNTRAYHKNKNKKRPHSEACPSAYRLKRPAIGGPGGFDWFVPSPSMSPLFFDDTTSSASSSVTTDKDIWNNDLPLWLEES
jgi:outer membrane biosynthesis protein TonB